MSGAAEILTRRLIASGARRIAFLGLAKNAGKTTALVATLAELHRQGVAAGATSSGRDGEDFDALTGEPKPRFRLWPGQLLASADGTFASGSIRTSPVRTLDMPTRFGPVRVVRVEEVGELEVMGPTTASQTAAAAEALEAEGARLVLLDGAFGRRAFASARVADGVVLAVGMSAGRSLDIVLERARLAAELFSLARPPAGARARRFPGALTDEALGPAPPDPGEVLVAEDFASIFLSPERRRALSEGGVRLATEHPTRLLALTVNPSAPGRGSVPAAAFLEAVGRVVRGVPVFDLAADLSRDPGADDAPAPTSRS